MSRRARLAWLVALSGPFAVACVEPAGAARITGPDGTAMLHVHCGDEQVACFQLAGELCPHGYYLSPIFDPHDGNFLVRCKPPGFQIEVAVTANPPLRRATVAPNATATATPEQTWPPVGVAKPAEPWPATGSTPPQNSIRDVDLVY